MLLARPLGSRLDAVRPTQPYSLPLFGAAGVPERHRREVRERRLVVADALHDRDLALVVEVLHPAHRLVPAELRVDFQDVGFLDADRRPMPVVERVAVRDDGVEAVVAAEPLEDDEDLARRIRGDAAARLGQHVTARGRCRPRARVPSRRRRAAAGRGGRRRSRSSDSFVVMRIRLPIAAPAISMHRPGRAREGPESLAAACPTRLKRVRSGIICVCTLTVRGDALMDTKRRDFLAGCAATIAAAGFGARRAVAADKAARARADLPAGRSRRARRRHRDVRRQPAVRRQRVSGSSG